MSFGFSVSDLVQLVQLAFRTVQNSRKACGEHDELTRETSSLHTVLRRLQQEASKPECPINRHGDTYRDELATLISGCGRVLNVMDKVLEKYNALGDQEKSIRKLWQKVRFGNGQMVDIGNLRSKISYYTSALSLFLNMVSMGSIGRVEKKMDEAGGELREIRLAVHSITAHLMNAEDKEGSILTAYADDDKAVWREFRRELIRDGFSSSILRKHKNIIQDYVKELGSRGLFDETDPAQPDEDSKETDEISEGFISDPVRDPASTVSGSKAEAFIKDRSARTGLNLHPSDSGTLHGVPQATKRAQSYQHSLEESDVVSESESIADGWPDESDHKPSASLRNDSNHRSRGFSRKFSEEDEHTIKETLDASQTQERYQQNTDQKYGFWSSGFDFEVDNTFHMNFSRRNRPISGVKTYSLLNMFQGSVSRMLRTYSVDLDSHLRVADDDVPNDMNTLMDRAESCVALIRRMYFLLSEDSQKTLESAGRSLRCFSHQSGKRSRNSMWSEWLEMMEIFIPSDVFAICEEFLQEAIGRQDSSCRELLIDIDTWMSDFGTATSDRRRAFKSQLIATRILCVWEWDDGCKDLEVWDSSYEGLDSKNTRQRLDDIYLILRHDFESQCMDFEVDTPSDPQTRDRDYTALSEGILQNVLLQLDDVPVGEDQVLRALRRKIASKANDVLKSIDQAKNGTTRPDVSIDEMYVLESPAESLYDGLQWTWKRRRRVSPVWAGKKETKRNDRGRFWGHVDTPYPIVHDQRSDSEDAWSCRADGGRS
ncbi:hypothetical protein MMC22_004749 [Lobaria immixta]|nr:hypothetical protein [Lobaria immixta]